MKYTREGENVTLEITQDDYMQLLVMMGIATGAVIADKPMFYRCIRFINELNAGNPNFTPYEIPAEFTKAAR